MTDPHLVTDEAALDALYGPVGEASRVKVADRITPEYRPYVEHAPFLVLASSGPDGLDCSPRGDGPGFVRLADERTLHLPDRRGNNRVDSLRNIIRDPRVGLLFFVPGIGETLRVNGRAAISAAPDLLESFAVDGRAPRTVLVIAVESVFFQCSRAVVRSGLWDPARHLQRGALPTPGTILAAQSRDRIDGTAYDAELPGRIKATLY